MKLNPSVKVTVVALGVFAAGFAAYWLYGETQLAGFNPDPIAPGKVTMVAFKTGGNLRIRVANRVAQLVELQNANADNRASAMEADVSDARRIPIRELLQTLQGDEKALGDFLMAINRIGEGEVLPPEAPVWSAADLQKAIDGDPGLVAKLESDLHIGLDGIPPDNVRMAPLQDGIIIELPVQVQVQVGNEVKTLTGIVRENYRPRFAIEFEKTLFEEFEPTETTIVGNYREIATPLVNGENKPEDVRASLQSQIDEKRKKSLADKPERLLRGAQVLVADQLFEGASYRGYKDDRGADNFDLKIQVSEEARKRLWKYSRDTQGFELLLVVDGIAVAAPRITTQLNGREVTITKLKEQSLVERTIEAIKEAQNGKQPS